MPHTAVVMDLTLCGAVGETGTTPPPHLSSAASNKGEFGKQSLKTTRSVARTLSQAKKGRNARLGEQADSEP